MSRDWSVKTSLAVLICGFTVSCVSRQPSITSHDPDDLIPAIKTEVAAGHRQAIPYLVDALASDDAAVRMYAIDGLRRLTGQDLGFVYFADDEDRQPAVQRWKLWLAGDATTQPSK